MGKPYGIVGKKDSLGAREDLRAIRRLPPSATPRMGPHGKMVLPKSPWILSKVDQERMKQVIASICTPTGYMRSLKGALNRLRKEDLHNSMGSNPMIGIRFFR